MGISKYDIITEEYELLSDDEKKLHYQNVDINTQTNEQKGFIWNYKNLKTDL